MSDEASGVGDFEFLLNATDEEFAAYIGCPHHGGIYTEAGPLTGQRHNRWHGLPFRSSCRYRWRSAMTAQFDVGHRVIAVNPGDQSSVGRAAPSIFGYYGHVQAVTTDVGGHTTMWTMVEGRIGGRPCHPAILGLLWPFGDHELEHAD